MVVRRANLRYDASMTFLEAHERLRDALNADLRVRDRFLSITHISYFDPTFDSYALCRAVEAGLAQLAADQDRFVVEMPETVKIEVAITEGTPRSVVVLPTVAAWMINGELQPPRRRRI